MNDTSRKSKEASELKFVTTLPFNEMVAVVVGFAGLAIWTVTREVLFPIPQPGGAVVQPSGTSAPLHPRTLRVTRAEGDCAVNFTWDGKTVT